MSVLKTQTARALRSVARANPTARKIIERWYNRPRVITGETFEHTTGRSYTIVRSRTSPEARRLGIYLRGGCDLPAMFGIARLMRNSVTGTCAIWRDPINISGSRSDFILQALDGIDPAAEADIDEVSRRFHLRRGHFAPRIFEPTFTIPRQEALGPFPKSVVALSSGGDFTRTMYRHREHGFLVDPGGFWLGNNVESALTDPESVRWFAKNFKSVGRMSVDEFRSSFARLITEVKARTGAHVLAFNVLTVDPLELTHSYGLVQEPDTARRRDFTVALAELSRMLDFDIIDVDRILKLDGLRGQVDFAHISEAQFAPIATESYRVLREREIL
jgi:hypothetical protein